MIFGAGFEFQNIVGPYVTIATYCHVPGKWGLQQTHLPRTDQITQRFSPLYEHEHKAMTDTCIHRKTGWACHETIYSHGYFNNIYTVRKVLTAS